VPAYQGGKWRWAGYPYENTEDIEPDLTEFLCAELAPDNASGLPAEGDSVLLMTHIGPGGSSTAIQQIDLDQPDIKAGCFVLDKLLRLPASQKRIFLNIHGHIHFGEGASKIGTISIFNPGSVAFDNFGLVSIKRKDDQWTYQSMNLHQL